MRRRGRGGKEEEGGWRKEGEGGRREEAGREAKKG